MGVRARFLREPSMRGSQNVLRQAILNFMQRCDPGIVEDPVRLFFRTHVRFHMVD